jgi:hypothetical protein
MLNLWKEYSDILEKKRLNILIENRIGKKPIDLLDKKDLTVFLDIVEESYFNRLQRAGEEGFSTEWENICSSQFKENDKNILSVLGNNVNSKNFKIKCKTLIKDKLTNLITKFGNKQKNDCTQQSFPLKKIKQCVDINESTNIDMQTFTGNTLDVLIGLIYLLEKHSKIVCSTLSLNYTNNNELCKFYKNMGVIVNSKCEFLNFEIMWIMSSKLYFPEPFYDNFKKCINKENMGFVIIPLGIISKDNAHANYLIYDILKKELCRFETHGKTVKGMDYNASLLDELLKNKFTNIDNKIKYISPNIFLPSISFQSFESYEKNNKHLDDIPFCALWAIYFVDQQLTYAEIPREKLVRLLLENIRKSKTGSFRTLIRNYSKNITNIRDEILKSANLDINDWQNNNYTDLQINTVTEKLNNRIKNIIV